LQTAAPSEIFVGPFTLLPFAGELMVATGPGALIVSAKVAVLVPLLFVALMVTLKHPETDGVPEIRQVEVLTERLWCKLRPTGSSVGLRLAE
jgi:hypothetical protein